MLNILQTKLIYYPKRGYHATPADLGLDYENLRLTTSDGVSITAWYIPHPQAVGTVLFFHGNAGNIAGRLGDVERLHPMGVNVLLIDYRGFGESDGKPSEEGTYLDAEAGWVYLTETLGQWPEQIVILGRSLGGAVAIDLAEKHTPAGLVVESTFTNLIDVGKRLYPWLPVHWILTYHYDSLSKVSRVHCPKLFFHGIGDELITLENGRRLFDKAVEPKEFVETAGNHSTGGYAYDLESLEKFRTFLMNSLQSGK